MGITLSPNQIFPYSSHDVSTDELTLEQAQFMSFAGEYLGHLSNEDYVEYLEGYLETQLVSKHKSKTLSTIFTNRILPNFFHLPINATTPPDLPLVPALLEVLSGTSSSPLLSQLVSFYPDGSLMWYR